MVHYGNQNVIFLIKNPQFYNCTKHIDVKLHFIREMIEQCEVELVKIHMDDNPTNMGTKMISLAMFMKCQTLIKVTITCK